MTTTLLDKDSRAASDRARAEHALESFLNAGLLKADYISLTENDPPSLGAIEGTKGMKRLPNGDFILLEYIGGSWEEVEGIFASPESLTLFRNNTNEDISLFKDEINEDIDLFKNETNEDIDLFKTNVNTSLEAYEAAQTAGVIGFASKSNMDADTSQSVGALALVTNDSTTANNGWYRWSGSAWVKSSGFFSAAIVKDWVASESFGVSSMTYSANGNISGAVLLWPDGEAGTISNLEEDSQGRIESLRFNRPDSKYITVSITYDGDDVDTVTYTPTGY